MAGKHHHMPLSGGDRKAFKKEIVKSRAMTRIFAERSAEKRRVGEALIREADNLARQSWNEKMWSDGGPIRCARPCGGTPPASPKTPLCQSVAAGCPDTSSRGFTFGRQAI
jgi:hypothetical protein